jgi:hypothetical protein
MCRNESHFLRDSIVYSMENDAYPLAMAQNAPYRLHESELMAKTNPEIAVASIRIVGIAVMALVAITSRYRYRKHRKYKIVSYQSLY